MNSKPKIQSSLMSRGYLPSYASLPGAYPCPPNKPLPQLPSSPRYNLFPKTHQTSHQLRASSSISSISSHSLIATASLPSVSNISTGEATWDTDSGTVSRPDSCTLPPTPGLRREGPRHDAEDGLFFALEKKNGVVRFWVRAEHALLESSLVLEGIPVEEAERVSCMARETLLDCNWGGMVEHVQLLVGTFREGDE